MNDILLAYINQHFVDEEEQESVTENDDLLSEGILDSLGMMKLIRFVEDEFDVKVQPEDMTVENFTSVRSIVDYLKSQ